MHERFKVKNLYLLRIGALWVIINPKDKHCFFFALFLEDN